jgi:hypothetical protein
VKGHCLGVPGDVAGRRLTGRGMAHRRLRRRWGLWYGQRRRAGLRSGGVRQPTPPPVQHPRPRRPRRGASCSRPV